MHIAAANPLVVTREQVPAEKVEEERSIFRRQVINEGKPEKVVDKIVEGKLEKFFSEVVLLEQPYVRDPAITIKDLITNTIAKIGENISVNRFVRYRIGE